MSKLFQRVAAGWVSVRTGPRDLEWALRREWRAVRTAEQDRAHLATLMCAPGAHDRPAEWLPAPAPSLAPPHRD